MTDEVVWSTKNKRPVVACWNIKGLKSKIQIRDYRGALKEVDFFGAVETWFSLICEVNFDGYEYIT